MDKILIPKNDVSEFAVVACDQFTSERSYWDSLYEALKGRVSALDLILPECYLNEDDLEARLESIGKNARRCLSEGAFFEFEGNVFTERTTAYGRARRGLVRTINLDDYDYRPSSAALIRASEHTIQSRLAPRIRIRANSPLELPHILLLADDESDLLMTAALKSAGRTLYEGTLNQNGGRIKGRAVTDTRLADAAIETLFEKTSQKYKTPLLYLAGDGNHSLAAAKECAATGGVSNRALCEIVNLYDEGLVFEPIHRYVKTADPVKFARLYKAETKGEGRSELYLPEALGAAVPSDPIQMIETTDAFIEKYIADFGGEADYVHGEEALKAAGGVGIRMNALIKNELFEAVVRYGCLPKKSFSLGEASEKRYYVEARRITDG